MLSVNEFYSFLRTAAKETMNFIVFHSQEYVFHSKGTDKKLQLVMIDTVLLCGNTAHDGFDGNNAQGK